MPQKKPKNDPAIATNRRARHEYAIEQTWECGIQLVGSEVKTLRAGKCSLADSYGVVRKGEIFLYNVHIPEYAQAAAQNHEPVRARKLLLHKHEIEKIAQKTEAGGYTLVPLKVYFKGNHIKVELGLAKGKREYDKRQTLIKKEHERDMARASSAALRRRR
jgi:SsrA-binding protein